MDYRSKSNQLRLELFKKMAKMQQGHPGSIFSIIDFLTVLYYGKFIKYSKIKKKFEDKLIISKGHATSSLYPIMRDFGVLSKKDWNNWGSSKSSLRVFGNISIPGVDMTSGSLGHGLGVGAGMAISNIKNKNKNKVYVIISEGEFYEGSTWESLLFIKNYNLKNLKIIVDVNNLIILGKTNECLKINPLDKKIKSLGLKTKSIDGHNYKSLESGIKSLNSNSLDCLILNTIKGKGLSLMENKPDWHYWNKLESYEVNKYIKELESKC